jgi:hypothetical protein
MKIFHTPCFELSGKTSDIPAAEVEKHKTKQKKKRRHFFSQIQTF